MNNSPLLVSPLMNYGVNPSIPSDIMSVTFVALVTNRNFVLEAFTDPEDVRLTKSLDRLPETLPIP